MMLSAVQDSLIRVQAQFPTQPFDTLAREDARITIPNSTRQTLVKMLASLQMNSGAEVGVERGVFSKALLRANPLLHLYGIDPWAALPDYRVHLTQEFMDAMYDEVCRRLASYNWTPIRAMSRDAASQIPDRSLDFVYIDANHAYEYTMEDLEIWTKKVRVGGIISGHDYTTERQRERNDVVRAVHTWTKAHDISPWFVLGSDTPMPGEERDRSRSYFWVNI